MGRVLGANVLVRDELDNTVLLVKGTKLPREYADQVGDHCLADEDADEPAEPVSEPVTSGPPPKAGTGSSGEAWAAYAASLDVAVDDGAGRDAIMQAIADAGHPVE